MATIKELFNLSGRTSVITGGGTGLGLQMASALAEAGSNLVLCARKVERCEEAAIALRALGVDVLALACDVTKPDQVNELCQKTLQRFGRVDVLVNNAGRAWVAAPEEMPLDGWQRVMDLNLTGSFVCAQTFGREMIRAQRGGRIINISSIAGLGGRDPAIYDSIAYATSKGGLVNMTRDLAVKWARHRINVNCICPGVFPSALSLKMFEERPETILTEIPLRRLGGADDLKGIAVLLASDASAFMTGTIIPVDGGHTAW